MGIAVRADVFYRNVVNAAGEMAFIGVHPVALGNYHASVIVFAGNDSNLLELYDYYLRNTFHGLRYATMGAGASTWNITGYVMAGFNRERDAELWRKNEMIHLSTNNPSSYELLFTGTQNFIDNRHSLSAGIQYALFPMGNAGNSNSFAHGLVRYAGFNTVTPRSNVPGWSIPIEAQFFE